jgi:Peptidase family M28
MEGESLIERLAGGIGPRPAGSAASTRAAEVVSAAFREEGAAVNLEWFPYLGWQGGPVSLAVNGEEYEAAPCTWGLATPAGGARGVLASLGSVTILAGLLEAEAFGVIDSSGSEVARIYVNPYGVAAAPFPSGRGPNLTGSAVWVSTEDGRRLAGLDGSTVSVEIPDGVKPMSDSNVVAEIPGRTEEVVLACAHYDSAWNAPGFVDNATGVEWLRRLLAEVAAGPTPRRTLRVCACAAEEIGLLGARRHAATAASSQTQIRVVVNFDAVGGARALDLHASDRPAVLSAVDAVVDQLEERFTVSRHLPGPGSDHLAFHEIGIPVVAFVGPPDYPTYHQPDETVAAVDPELVALGVKAAAEVAMSLLSAD